MVKRTEQLAFHSLGSWKFESCNEFAKETMALTCRLSKQVADTVNTIPDDRQVRKS